MFLSILRIYIYAILFAILTTLIIIFCGFSWGKLPHYYLRFILYLQSFFSEDGVVLPSIKRNPSSTYKWLFGRSLSVSNVFNNESISDKENRQCNLFEEGNLNKLPGPGSNRKNSAFEWNLELIRDGIESVIQDDISENFIQSSLYRNAEPRSLRDLFFYYKRERKRRRSLQNKCKSLKYKKTATKKETKSNCKIFFQESLNDENLSPLKFHPFIRSCLLLLISRIFRVGILFPIRLGLLISSFIYLFFACTFVSFVEFSEQTKTRIGITYCRIFCAGTGLIARYHNVQHRPTRPGVAVSNHLSPNDIQIICADVSLSREYLYIVTGQKHKGIIWAIERFVEKLCPSIWLERSSPDDRKKFTQSILDLAKVSGPILIFPEGYCTNNNRILQFRRAVFDMNVAIHPIAIKQDARFGDSFWSEDKFFHYLARVLSSWAIVYDVTYLPSEIRQSDENAIQFAARIQNLIAETIGVECANFDGGLFYKAAERQKYRKVWVNEFAKQVQKLLNDPPQAFNINKNSTETPLINNFNIINTKIECLNDDNLINNQLRIDSSTDLKNESEFRVRKTTFDFTASGYKVLKRKRYNSLNLLQRQVSFDED